MPEVPLQHGTQSLSRAGDARTHLHRRSHKIAHWCRLWIHMAERHSPQDVALGEDSRNAVLVVDDGYRAYMMVEHLVDGVGDGGLQTYRGNLPITKFQHTHSCLLRPHD